MLGAQQLFPGTSSSAQASSGAPAGMEKELTGPQSLSIPGAWRTAQVGPGLPHPAALGPRDEPLTTPAGRIWAPCAELA